MTSPSEPLWNAKRKRHPLKAVLPGTLFGRSLLIIVTPVILLQLISMWVYYDRHLDSVTARMTGAVAADIAFVIDRLAADPAPERQAEILSSALKNMNLLMSLDPSGAFPRIPENRGHGFLYTSLDNAIRSGIRFPAVVMEMDRDNWYEVRVRLDDRSILSVMVPRKRFYSSTAVIWVLWMIGSSIVLLVVALVFMRNQIRPLRRLALAVERFGKGREVPDFRPEGALEVRRAAVAFQGMKERIQRQIVQRTEMLAGVSHDLRTPLTRMKLQLAMLPDSPDIRDLKKDISDMETMIEGYLAFARGEGEEVMQPVSLSRILEEVIGSIRHEKGSTELSVDGELVLPLRSAGMKRCLTNIIHNARRYALATWVHAQRQGDAVIVTVDDNGPGIPAALRDSVFRPFFRVEGSRNAATGGVGLGLTIARDIAHSHGGEISLSDSPRGGLRVTVSLPV
ncbi:MAG: ATP-binding protein [Pseudomonadota bacterium]|nr:ATP-binding protein [Pseudomonadota bacterium]